MRCTTLITNKSTKAGFTLVELIVALAIIGLTGVISAHFWWPSLNSYQRLSARTEGRYLCETLFQVMEAELRYGKDFMAAENGTLEYVVIEGDGTQTTHECPAGYDSSDLTFIPVNCLIKISYQVSRTSDQVLIMMTVLNQDAEGEMTVPVYEQEVVFRSLYQTTSK